MTATYWINKEKLTAFIEDRNNEDMLDTMFFDLFEIEPTGLTECPYWYEEYAKNDYMVEYQSGYYEPLEIGTIRDGYKYIDSISLPEEQEHQAEDGSLVYEYRGASFLRVWQPVN